MHDADQPSRWVQRWAHLVPAGTPVLDVACGGGRHSRLFAGMGHLVVAVDRSPSLADGDGITVVHHDLEDGTPVPWRPASFGGVVVTNYLHRPLLPDLVEALVPGGVLIYETFAAGHERYGRPSRPEFLLQPGELLSATAGLEMVEYRCGHEPDRQAITQSIVVRRPVT